MGQPRHVREPTLVWMTSSFVCFQGSLSLSLSLSLSSRRPPGVTHPALTRSLLSSSIFFSVSFVSKMARKRRSNPRTHCRVYESILSGAHPRHRQDGKASTDPEKEANFREDFSPLSRKSSTLEITESYCEKARARRKQTRQSWKDT